MGMGEQDRIERFGVEAQISVFPIGFVSASLEEPAIQQEFEAWNFKHMAASRH